MSGGHFNYVQHQMMNVIEDLKEVLSDDVYPPEQRKAMQKGLLLLKIATVYVDRIDYYVCGDDGDETFLERLRSDLRRLKQDEH